MSEKHRFEPLIPAYVEIIAIEAARIYAGDPDAAVRWWAWERRRFGKSIPSGRWGRLLSAAYRKAAAENVDLTAALDILARDTLGGPRPLVRPGDYLIPDASGALHPWPDPTPWRALEAANHSEPVWVEIHTPPLGWATAPGVVAAEGAEPPKTIPAACLEAPDEDDEAAHDRWLAAKVAEGLEKLDGAQAVVWLNYRRDGIDLTVRADWLKAVLVRLGRFLGSA